MGALNPRIHPQRQMNDWNCFGARPRAYFVEALHILDWVTNCQFLHLSEVMRHSASGPAHNLDALYTEGWSPPVVQARHGAQQLRDLVAPSLYNENIASCRVSRQCREAARFQ